MQHLTTLTFGCTVIEWDDLEGVYVVAHKGQVLRADTVGLLWAALTADTVGVLAPSRLPAFA